MRPGPHRPPALGPIGRFVRAKLRRRLFAWFLGGTVVTALVVGLSMGLLSRLEAPQGQAAWQRARDWAGRQFARRWMEPPAREAFARETAREFAVELELLDASGAPLFATGRPCPRPWFEAPVRDGGPLLGTVRVCHPGPGAAPWRMLVAVALFLAVTWKVSGLVARRLASPLDELAAVVQRIGEGDLGARARRSCREPDEVGVVAEAVNDMAARLEQQATEQRELLAAVSHELRTPLARLRVLSELAREGAATPKTFDEVDREVEELDALVGELLDRSRLEFGQVGRRALSLRDVATRAVERAGLPPTSLSVTGEGDELWADPTLLLRALANLLDNAAKHAGGADAVEVTVGAEEVRFEVLDRGPGPGEDGAALLEKFNRGRDGQGAHGLGLGLALVKRIAEAHGGTAWVLPREGGGARTGFSVTKAASQG